jgi:hypothetical protein
MSSITIRVTDAQKEKLKELAREDGRRLSDFIRRQFETRILPPLESSRRRRPRKGGKEAA